MKKVFLAFVIGLVLMAAGNWLWNHQNSDNPSTEEDKDIWGRGTKTIAVDEVVNEIRPLNRLVVFQAYITATTTTHDIGWFTQSDQTMITPAYVNYFVKMETITSQRVRVRGQDVFIAIPAIMIERPNIDTLNIRTFNAGIWSNMASTSDLLRVKNSKMALGQLFQRAKTSFLVNAAKAASIAAVEANIRNALAVAGHADLKIHVIAAS